MRLLKKISLVIASFLLIAPVLAPVTTFAADNNVNSVCQGLELTGGKCGDEKPGETGVNSVIKTVINILSLAVGVISVVMIIIGGLKYVLSSGDSSNINSAKNTILYALVGLIIVALAQIIVKFTLNTVSKPKCAQGQVSTSANPCTP